MPPQGHADALETAHVTAARRVCARCLDAEGASAPAAKSAHTLQQREAVYTDLAGAASSE